MSSFFTDASSGFRLQNTGILNEEVIQGEGMLRATRTEAAP